jgi:hypothetical protein
MYSFRISIFLALISLSSYVSAEVLSMSVNPLITYQEQLKQIRKECRAAGFPPECEKRIADLEKEQEKLQDFCAKNSRDTRCDSIKRKSASNPNAQEEFCSENPDSSQCIRRKERKRMTQRYMLRFCRINPENLRCKPKIAYRKKESYIEKFCKDNPTEKKCVIFFERSGRAVKKDDSGQPNTF